ncbi:hypothetical protein [Metabacillus litoralis]|uniref:hypothetical protein n=1 Tax=Metabacillus litoralis TaxID=152268 RepID=UPI0020404AED|nr:hypothetical protein [Metabacillus litoralis]MCM3410012.1 hypothetical protein [Metabacillus litoralis]
MNQKLWEVIKQISEQKNFGASEMALAYETLDTNTFSVLQEQLKDGLFMRNEQWI